MRIVFCPYPSPSVQLNYNSNAGSISGGQVTPVSENPPETQIINLQMEGFVRDANNFSPLSRATVDLFIGGEIGDSGVILAMEDLRYVYTDETGYYYIKRSTIFRGEYPKLYLRARAGGYHGSEFFSIQRTDAVQRIDIYLEPSEN